MMRIQQHFVVVTFVSLLLGVYFRGIHRILSENDHAANERSTLPNTVKDNPAFQLQQLHQWWNDQIDGASLIWEPQDLSQFCFFNKPRPGHGHQDQDQTDPAFIYVKVPKTASSTSSGLNIRMATKVGERIRKIKIREKMLRTSMIATNSTGTLNSSARTGSLITTSTNLAGRANHTNTNTNTTNHRDKNYDEDDVNGVCAHSRAHGHKFLLEREPAESLLWTFLRDPAQRALSAFYHFQVSRRDIAATDETTTEHLSAMKSYQFRYIADHPNAKKLQEFNPFRVIQKFVMEPYSFIGLLERKEESLAVMKLLWNLQMSDMIVLAAKQAGKYDDGQYEAQCIKIQKPKNISFGVQDYLLRTFPQSNHDYALYSIVNRSLDLTIDSLGRERVQTTVQELRTMQLFAESKCLESTIFPCSSNGTRQTVASRANCYWTDAGCGYPCVDRVLKDFNNEDNNNSKDNGNNSDMSIV